MVAAFFILLLVASCAYASFAGGREGRCVSIFLIAATILSVPAGMLDIAWARTQLPVLAVDLLLLIGLLAISLRSRRYWPMWLTAFHLITVCTHVATVAEVKLPPLIYFAMQSFWSLPAILSMVGGIMLDRRAGLPKDPERVARRRDEQRDVPSSAAPKA